MSNKDNERLEHLLLKLGSNAKLNENKKELHKAATNIGLCYITDMETDKILFANDNMIELFGDIEGKNCHEAIQDLTCHCNFCTNDIIRKQPGVPYKWVFHNKKVDKTYLINDIYLYRQLNGSKVHFRYELAIEIDEKIKQDLQKLWQEQDNIQK
jgi:hypothetical protein